jgi:hypothetical protein
VGERIPSSPGYEDRRGALELSVQRITNITQKIVTCTDIPGARAGKHRHDCALERGKRAKPFRSYTFAHPEPHSTPIDTVGRANEKAPRFESPEHARQRALVQLCKFRDLTGQDAWLFLHNSEHQPLRSGNSDTSMQQFGGTVQQVLDGPQEPCEFECGTQLSRM